jgi:hypothetical protein
MSAPGRSSSLLSLLAASVLLPAQIVVVTSQPSDFVQFTQIQTVSGWLGEWDPGTSGGATGTPSNGQVVSSPSLSGNSRQFQTSYTDYGGYLYYVDFGENQAVHSFLYDAYVYIQTSAAGIANIEMDMNQVLSNGNTVIYGFQCDGDNNTWDYTENTGTPTEYNDQWVHTSIACNPQNWSLNTWHHVQIAYSRDSTGNVTYQWVSFDGTQSLVNETVLSAFSLGWANSLVTNFQIDGATSGSRSSVVFLDKLTVSMW